MKHPIRGVGKSSFDLINSKVLFEALQLKNGDIFLDLGCGRGEYTLLAADFVGEKGLVCGIDLWEEGVTTLRQKASTRGLNNVIGLIGDMSKSIPLDGNSVDACLMGTVLHDLAEVKAAQETLQEVQRVMKKGGTLAILEFKKIDGPPGPPVHIRLTPEDVSQMVAPYGFRKRRLIEVGDYNYLILFSAGDRHDKPVS